MKRPILIGIAGGTGSGKSTVARAIFESLQEKNIAIIEQDSYYKDQAHLTYEERIKTNYVHPLAFDTNLLISHLNQLLENKSIEKPIYDFLSTQERLKRLPSNQRILLFSKES